MAPCVEGRLSQRASDPQSTGGPKEAPGGDFAGGEARADRVMTVMRCGATGTTWPTGVSPTPSSASAAQPGTGGAECSRIFAEHAGPPENPLWSTPSPLSTPLDSSISSAISTSTMASSTMAISAPPTAASLILPSPQWSKKSRRKIFKAERIADIVDNQNSIKGNHENNEEVINEEFDKHQQAVGDRASQADQRRADMEEENLRFFRLKQAEWRKSDKEWQARNSRSNTTAQRDAMAPNAIERAAMAVFGAPIIAKDDDIHNNGTQGSIGELRPSADDDSCRGGVNRSRTWHPLYVETQESAVSKDGGFQGISTLLPVRKNAISVVHRPDEWIEIEVTVDSGACVTVMPRSMCEGISILQNALSREGVEYEVANGAHIPNLGERRCEMMTVGSLVSKRITFQVADVHKPLLSVTGCADMGFDCYLGEKSGFLLDRVSGERIPLERRENLYVMRTWVRQDPSVSISQPFVGQG